MATASANSLPGAGATSANFTYQNFNYPFTINAYGDATHPNVYSEGKGYLTADNLRMVEGTVSIFGNDYASSDLVVTGKMEFAYTGHINGPGTLTNNGTVSIADGDISAHVDGHGTLELHQYHDRTGAQTISGAIDGGQDVKIMPNNQGTRTELVNPNTFKGTLDLVPGPNSNSANLAHLEIDGIHASRVDIRNDMLRLYGAGNKPLWQVHENMPAGYTASMTDTATGTEITFLPPPTLLG